MFRLSALLVGVTAAGVLEGDFNGDGIEDNEDLNLLVLEIIAGTNDPTFDLTDDGVVNLDDVRGGWLPLAGAHNLPSGNPYPCADGNLDGVVDGHDFAQWNSHKFESGHSATPWTDGDWNADGAPDALDLATWSTERFTGDVDGVPMFEPEILDATPGQDGDGVPDLAYDGTTGLLVVSLDGGALNGLLIDGPDASNVGLDWEDGSFDGSNTWVQAYFDGAEQWIVIDPLHDVSHGSNERTIADYGPGLDTNDFGEIWIIIDEGLDGGEIYRTAVVLSDPCPEDIDGSGVVDFADILAIIVAWGNPGGPEDLDGSGVVDFADIMEVLTAWGACP